MTTQKPSVGRIVLVPTTALQLGPGGNNSADVAPAIITRVWNDGLVNVRVLLDGNDTLWKTSIPLHGGPDEYEAARDAGSTYGCYWPTRV